MEHLLHNIINHISANMPSLAVVDEDYGQLEAIDNDAIDQYPLLFPAVLIDAPQTEWTNIAGNCQKGVVTLRVRLIIDCYDDTHAGSLTTQKIIEREAVRRQLHSLLQGWRADDDGALVRQTSRFFTFNHGIKVYETTYTAEVSEFIKETTEAPSRLKLKLYASAEKKD